MNKDQQGRFTKRCESCRKLFSIGHGGFLTSSGRYLCRACMGMDRVGGRKKDDEQRKSK